LPCCSAVHTGGVPTVADTGVGVAAACVVGAAGTEAEAAGGCDADVGEPLLHAAVVRAKGAAATAATTALLEALMVNCTVLHRVA
jgi:hypothetical protein